MAVVDIFCIHQNQYSAKKRSALDVGSHPAASQ